jgi:hypothetical protein
LNVVHSRHFVKNDEVDSSGAEPNGDDNHLFVECIDYPKRRSKKQKRARREKANRRARSLLLRKLSEEPLPKGTGGNEGAETDQKQASGAKAREWEWSLPRRRAERYCVRQKRK